MTRSSTTAQSKTINFFLASLLSLALAAGAIISVALYAGFEGFDRGEIAVEQTYSDDLPQPLIKVRDDYAMVKLRYSWIALLLLTALALHLVVRIRTVNWFIIGLVTVAAYQFKDIFWYKNAAFSTDRPRFAFMRDTYSLDIAICALILIVALSLFIKLFKSPEP